MYNAVRKEVALWIGEHYVSHVLDMRGVSLGTLVRLHGIQVAVGTLLSARIYDKLRTYTPDPKKAADFVTAFDANAAIF